MAQGYQFPSHCSSCSGQVLSFRGRSKSHGSRLGGPYPGSGALAHGSRLMARGSGHGSRLPISFPLSIHTLKIIFKSRGSRPTARGSGLLIRGSRLTPRGSGHGSRLPISFLLLIVLGPSTFILRP